MEVGAGEGQVGWEEQQTEEICNRGLWDEPVLGQVVHQIIERTDIELAGVADEAGQLQYARAMGVDREMSEGLAEMGAIVENLRLQRAVLGLQDSAAVSRANGGGVFDEWEVWVCAEPIRERVGLNAPVFAIDL